MFIPKVIKTEVISKSISWPLVRVTFEDKDGHTWFGDMKPDNLKVHQFREQMSHILSDKQMEELEDVLDISYHEGYDSGNEAGYYEGSGEGPEI